MPAGMRPAFAARDAKQGRTLEESAPVDRNVQRVVGRRDVPLGELLEHRRHRRSDPHLGCTAAAERRRIDVGKMPTGGFEANRAAVSDVVTHHIQRFGRSVESAQTLLK